ncbi:MAG TPA: glycosyltransferase family 39 protein [Xanthobacteraceae bacterium]|nr:glycosyltransferase family 39 protein [Xanthobacteraceae bacterium]
MFAAPIDGLCDPQRWRRTALGLAAAYAAVWTLYGVIAKSSQDINADVAEMLIWAHEPALGYPKHPPLLAYVVRLWFSIFPAADWAFTLLAMVIVAAGIYLAVELTGLWLDGNKRAAAPFLLAAIPLNNFLALKLDPNSALIPLWALTTWAFVHALRTRRAGWAVLTGLAAAAAMLTKYWSGFLLAAMVLAAVCDERRRDYWRSSAPWIAAGVFVLAVLPHGVWLVQQHFPPLTWIETRRAAHSAGDLIGSFAEYGGGTIGYASAALGLAAILFRPSGAAVRDSWFALEPARRPATLLFWTLLLLPLLVAIATRTTLLSLWNAPALGLLPVMMLASPRVVVSRLAVMRLAAVVTTLTLGVLAASPLVALTILKRGVENNAAYPRLAAAAIERQWRETTNAPLRILGGRFTLVTSTAFYMSESPLTYADFSTYLSPWLDPSRIAQDGLAIICSADDPWCLGKIEQYLGGNPAGRRSDVTLRRHWLGFAGPAKNFVIATVPPRS